MPDTPLEVWSVEAGVLRRRGRGTVTPPAPVPYEGTFLGDPGQGKYMLGAALGPYGNASISEMKTSTHYQGDTKTSVIHDYAGNAAVSGSKLDAAHNAGFIASQTFRLTGSSSSNTDNIAKANAVLNGSRDAEIDACAATCAARAPKIIWLCWYHEPESEWTTADSQALYRQAYRYIVHRFRQAGVTNVSWMPILCNPNTFTTINNALKWHPDWMGSGTGANAWQSDLTMDLFGIDTYNPLPSEKSIEVTDGKAFSKMFSNVQKTMDQAGFPKWDYVMPEYGMSNRMYTDRPSPTSTNWTQWAQDAINTAKSGRIKAFVYWDNSAEIGRYTFGPRPSNVPVSGTSPCSDCSPNTSYDTLMNKKVGWDLIANDPACIKVARS